MNHTIRILNSVDPKKCTTLEGHTDSLVSIIWNKRQNTIVTVDNSGNLRVWDVSTGTCKAALKFANIYCYSSCVSYGVTFDETDENFFVVFPKRDQTNYRYTTKILTLNSNGRLVSEHEVEGFTSLTTASSRPHEAGALQLNPEKNAFIIATEEDKIAVFEPRKDFVHIFRVIGS